MAVALTREGECRSKPLNFQEGSNDDSHYISHTHFLTSPDQSCSDRGRLLRGVFCASAGCLSLALQARITPCPVRGQDTPLPGVVSRKQDVLSFSARTHQHLPSATRPAQQKYLLSRAFLLSFSNERTPLGVFPSGFRVRLVAAFDARRIQFDVLCDDPTRRVLSR